MDDLIKAAVSGDSEEFARIFKERLYESIKKKRGLTTMKIEYNGFIGELVKLERKDLRIFGVDGSTYNLVIEDKEKHVKHDFDNVKLECVKFLGGAVSFG